MKKIHPTAVEGTSSQKNWFSNSLLHWYAQNARALPWRTTQDPYKIWLSEIMLQQTRVRQGLPYYQKFVKKYKTVKALAAAPLDEILLLWQGLGYYSRARNLHQCAKTVAEKFGGKFPDSFNALLSLPGIGPYTAAAIASFAFKKPHAVVDGNVFRVLARVFGIEANIATPAGQKYFQQVANEWLDKANPGLYNQAIMEFGSLQCTPQSPTCHECPLSKNCKAFQNELVAVLPIKSKAKPKKIRHFNYLVLKHGNRLWMRQRSSKDIWQGLFEFLLIEAESQLTASQIKKQSNIASLRLGKPIAITQTLSHQHIKGNFFLAEVTNGATPPTGGKFYSAEAIKKLAKPVLINRFLEALAL